MTSPQKPLAHAKFYVSQTATVAPQSKTLATLHPGGFNKCFLFRKEEPVTLFIQETGLLVFLETLLYRSGIFISLLCRLSG